MGILVDHQIRYLSTGVNRDGESGGPRSSPLPHPFSEGVQGNDVISYGLSHAGYDLRLGHTVRIFKNTHNEIVDPKCVKNDARYQSRIFDKITDITDGERIIIPPGSYILGYSLEYIRMPDWLKGTCIGKSTLARCGIHINTTPIEPGWEGYLTIEIANETPCPVAVYAGEGIAQIEFHTLTAACQKTYADKGDDGGKYQKQGAEPVPARVVT